MASLQLRDLERAIAMLPKSQRQAILLVGLEGMRYDEVARTLDVPVGTIRSRLSRGRAMLGKLMRGRREMTRRERRKPGYADRAA
jgi:RNA polymerase sigma-70 factor (ECF subfamily)